MQPARSIGRSCMQKEHDDDRIAQDEERFRLRIPLWEAMAFSLAWSDLGSAAPTDTERQLIGLLAVDTLQYDEEWRIAARLQACLVAKWPALRKPTTEPS